jgi:hypothetical protein
MAISWAPTTCLPVFVNPIFAEFSDYAITPGIAHVRVMKQWLSN